MRRIVIAAVAGAVITTGMMLLAFAANSYEENSVCLESVVTQIARQHEQYDYGLWKITLLKTLQQLFDCGFQYAAVGAALGSILLSSSDAFCNVQRRTKELVRLGPILESTFWQNQDIEGNNSRVGIERRAPGYTGIADGPNSSCIAIRRSDQSVWLIPAPTTIFKNRVKLANSREELHQDLAACKSLIAEYDGLLPHQVCPANWLKPLD